MTMNTQLHYKQFKLAILKDMEQILKRKYQAGSIAAADDEMPGFAREMPSSSA
ncbi:hypothetical protein AB2I57_25330 (plasmid) [Escherichia coli]